MSRTWKDTKAYRYRLSELVGMYAYGWQSPGNGKFWKRCLSKARRRSWQDPAHPGGLRRYESECNYKTY